MYWTNFKKHSLSLALASIVSAPLWADDTDIYLDSGLGGGTQSKPLVMLSLDWTPDLGGTECADAAVAACETHLGTEVYDNLDLVDDSGNIGANGVADSEERTAAEIATDYSGETVTMFDRLRASFRILFNELDGLYVAFMIFHDDTCLGNNASGPDEIPNGGSAGCSNGAYVLKGFFDPTDATERQNMNDKLAAMPVPGGTLSHTYQLKELYFEFFRYLTGQAVHNGHLGYDDFGSLQGNKNLGEAGNDVSSLLVWDGTVDTGGGATDASADYISPFDTDDDCSKIFAVNVLDGSTNQGNDSDNEIEDTLANGGLDLSSRDNQNPNGIIARMHDLDLASPGLGIDVDGDQTVTSYFVADNVNRTTNEWAVSGGTGSAYDLGNSVVTTDVLRTIFREILSVSTTFVAASVPVNVFNLSEVVDNLYVAIFKAEVEPRWPGNIKKLKIVEVTVDGMTSNQIQDADGDGAFSSVDGRIKTDALTYWTDPTGQDVIDFDADENEVTGKDGRSVTRGGAGQKLPGLLSDAEPGGDNSDTGARQLYTQDPSDTTNNNLTLLAYEDGNVSALSSYLDPDASYNSSEEEDFINWGRGIDVYNEDSDNSDDSRDWMLGDPMHSRPLVVNYGDTGSPFSRTNPEIRLFFGTNDGWFHIVENTLGSTQTGVEKFGFMPLEVMDIQSRIAENDPTSNIDQHPYGVDGETVVYILDNDSDGTIEPSGSPADKVYAYFGLRRGGKAYYAFDVSDPDATPTMKWKITNTGDFAELGMTFSTPRVTKVNYDGTTVDVLIFAGGYHGGWNAGARVGKDLNWGDSTEGNAIYIVNADTGALIWKAVDGSGTDSNTIEYQSDMDDAIPSTITVFDSNGNGITDRLYVGDTGGALWRVDLPEGSGSSHRLDNWEITKLAELGSRSAATDRRFFHAPDIVNTRDATGNYHGIIITSGDRADPLNLPVENYAYLIKDRVTTSGATVTMLIDETDGTTTNDLVDITDVCISGEEEICTTADLSKGWKLKLEDNGEKGLSTPLTAGGVIFFTSYLPEGASSDIACSPSEGDGRLYVVNLSDGSATLPLYNGIDAIDVADRYTTVGPGIPPGAKPLGDEILLPGLGIGGNQIISIGGKSRWKIYWSETDVDRL